MHATSRSPLHMNMLFFPGFKKKYKERENKFKKLHRFSKTYPNTFNYLRVSEYARLNKYSARKNFFRAGFTYAIATKIKMEKNLKNFIKVKARDTLRKNTEPSRERSTLSSPKITKKKRRSMIRKYRNLKRMLENTPKEAQEDNFNATIGFFEKIRGKLKKKVKMIKRQKDHKIAQIWSKKTVIPLVNHSLKPTRRTLKMLQVFKDNSRPFWKRKQFPTYEVFVGDVHKLINRLERQQELLTPLRTFRLRTGITKPEFLPKFFKNSKHYEKSREYQRNQNTFTACGYLFAVKSRPMPNLPFSFKKLRSM